MVDYTSEKMKHVAIGVVIAVTIITLASTTIINTIDTGRLEITKVSLHKISNDEALLTISVKNTGNTPIDNPITVWVYSTPLLPFYTHLPLGSTVNHTSFGKVLLPSETISHTDLLEIDPIIKRVDPSLKFEVGDSYPLVISTIDADKTAIWDAVAVYVTLI